MMDFASDLPTAAQAGLSIPFFAEASPAELKRQVTALLEDVAPKRGITQILANHHLPHHDRRFAMSIIRADWFSQVSLENVHDYFVVVEIPGVRVAQAAIRVAFFAPGTSADQAAKVLNAKYRKPFGFVRNLSLPGTPDAFRDRPSLLDVQMVEVHPAFRGLNLAQAVLTEALRVIAQQHKRAISLVTVATGPAGNASTALANYFFGLNLPDAAAKRGAMRPFWIAPAP